MHHRLSLSTALDRQLTPRPSTDPAPGTDFALLSLRVKQFCCKTFSSLGLLIVVVIASLFPSLIRSTKITTVASEISALQLCSADYIMSTSPTPLQADSGTSSKPDDNSLETFSAPSSSKPIAITSHDDGIVTSSFAGEVSQSGEVDVQVCRFFARRGWCKFKKSCRYLHERREPLPRTRRQQDAVIPGEIRDTASKAVDAVDLEAEDLSKSATTTLLEGPIKICKYFSKYGTCRYSARCKFRHEKDKPPRLPTDDDSSRELAETRDEDDQIEAAAKPVGVPVQKKDGRQRRRPRLCRYYKAGHCTMGNKCRFWHPKDVLDLDAPENGNFVDVARQETVTGTEQAGESVPAKKQPGRRVFSRPDKYKLEALADGELAKLRETEIEQIKKRYPNGQGEALGTRYGFQFILMPSDPDWVRTILLLMI